jgi:4'-phosphopantetheinyl transferase
MHCVESLGCTLDSAELRRAKRYRFERDRRRFIAARGLLREVLSRYVGVEPGQLCFCYGPQGKPQLVEERGADALRFNVSHAHELALLAVTRGREIGVDLEYVRPDLADIGIVERFFSPRETAALRLLPAAEQSEAFFNCWTRKEAYVKARGGGLSVPLDQFDVSLGPDEPAALLRTRGDAQEASRWSLRRLEPGPGYVGALAVEGHGWSLNCWQWEACRGDRRTQ